ncbi:deoxyxylulose-5-phosphate synthase [Streptomyces sp. NA02950]|uniref:deoxyxylulose-5-phosphate synthase n=1 Tax=Streptomyces sp. NA02950 TaxID=2742137 RepID=UPI0015907238|nr:deoxyxylulose-5-phosphate synthase [Streptomyces sp. NA02950]QKV93105.1 deoxyxylulose-5-phosphate synthase [Streptomyces sp. NA02950]
MPPAKSSWVCLPCRASYKQPRDARHPERRCPRCAEPLIHAGPAFAPPPRRDTEGWRTLSLLLHAGIRFFPMGCSCGPGYRPRTTAEVRERMAYARESGEPLARALVRAEVPWPAPNGKRRARRRRPR